jgi:hypothetical protein
MYGSAESSSESDDERYSTSDEEGYSSSDDGQGGNYGQEDDYEGYEDSYENDEIRNRPRVMSSAFIQANVDFIYTMIKNISKFKSHPRIYSNMIWQLEKYLRDKVLLRAILYDKKCHDNILFEMNIEKGCSSYLHCAGYKCKNRKGKDIIRPTHYVPFPPYDCKNRITNKIASAIKEFVIGNGMRLIHIFSNRLVFDIYMPYDHPVQKMLGKLLKYKPDKRRKCPYYIYCLWNYNKGDSRNLWYKNVLKEDKLPLHIDWEFY